jgi:oligopeptide/dipeptide ABC transporter ATP-binding protein
VRPNDMETPILQIRNLKKYFAIPTAFRLKDFFKKDQHKTLKAVDGVSFDVYAKETLGLVGESGCGKTTIGRVILRAIEPTSGDILFAGQPIVQLKEKELLDFRKRVQVVFQDPFLSLNPRMSIQRILREPLQVHRIVPDGEVRDKIAELMTLVGLDPNLSTLYPYELSTGQRKRVAIARAIATNPTLLVADEAVSGLDVSVKAQILNLMSDLRERLSLTYVFISHDLSVVQFVCHKVAIMYLGKIVEFGSTKAIFENPLHPYTVALLKSIPKVRAIGEEPIPIKSALKGEIPSPIDLPSGCRFQARCSRRAERCTESEPPMVEISKDQQVSCFLCN